MKIIEYTQSNTDYLSLILSRKDLKYILLKEGFTQAEEPNLFTYFLKYIETEKFLTGITFYSCSNYEKDSLKSIEISKEEARNLIDIFIDKENKFYEEVKEFLYYLESILIRKKYLEDE